MSLRILGIDFSAVFRRNWESTGGKELSEAYARTLRTVAEIREGFDRVALLCDSGPSFRKQLLPTYKADRERPPQPFYEQQNRTVARLMAEGCVAFSAPPYDPTASALPSFAEADDLCATLAAWCVSNDHKLVLYGGDKDLLQIVRDGVQVWRPDHDGLWDGPRVMADPKIGVAPGRIPDWLALGGDRSDGFKCFPGWEEADGSKRPGIGPTGATKMIAKFGSLMSVIDAACAEDKEGETPAFPPSHAREVIRRAQPSPQEAAMLGLQLATLVSTLPVDFSPLLAEPVFGSLSDDDEPAHVEAEAESTALARVPNEGIDRYALQPRTANGMMQMAEWLLDSHLYNQYPNAAAIFAVMLEANERGISAGLALRNAYVVKGKPAWSAAFIAALIKTSPVCKLFRIIESTTERAVLEYQRADEDAPSQFVFTIDEARAAGWLKEGSKWMTNPRTMLRWAAIREGGRAFFYDCVAGMYTP